MAYEWKTVLDQYKTPLNPEEMAGKPMEMEILKSYGLLKHQVLFNTRKSYKF